MAHCICFISADLQHDTGFVYTLQQTLTKYIKDKFSSIKRLEYFSDGCSGQFENFKNFFNTTLKISILKHLGHSLPPVMENLPVMALVEWSNEN